MKKKLAILTVVAMIAALISFNAIPAWAQTTWNVPGDTSGTCTTGNPSCDTIQEAIDAATSGDTVNVADGTYQEQVLINKGLSLLGQSEAGTILDGGSTDAVGIEITADNVEVRNFTIKNYSSVGLIPQHYLSGAWPDYVFRQMDNIKLQDVTVKDSHYGYYPTKVTNLIIDDCDSIDNTADGIFAMECPGIQITNCSITNSGDHGIWVGTFATWGMGPSDNAVISNNTVDGAREGGISFVGSDGATISGNTITNAAGEGPPSGWSVGALSIKDSCSNVEAYNNTIYNNSGTWGGYSGTGNGVGIDGTPSNINLHHNNIYGNTGYGCYNYSTVLVMAENNWWGDATGPYHPSTNPSGTGDSVSDYVDYDPWLGSWPATEVWVDDDYCDGCANDGHQWGYDAFDNIQDGIDNVAGSTVNVAAGTYNLSSSIVVDKSVTLTGDTTTPSNVVVNAATIPGYDRHGFRVLADNVTIQGFRIQGASQLGSPLNKNTAGIMIGGGFPGTGGPIGLENTQILDNEITDSSYGVYNYRCKYTTIARNTIWNIHMDQHWAGKGIQLYGDASGDPNIQNYGVQILDNEIYECGNFGIELNHWDVGPWVDINTTISGNTIHDNGGPFDATGWPVDCGRGISANGHEYNVTITDNEIYNHWGGNKSSTKIYPATGGIRVNDSKDFVITDNDVHDNFRGILIYGSDTTFGDENTGFAVTGNNVYHNAEGIMVGQGGSGDVGYAHYNYIHDNDDTTTDYYGSTVGPYGVVNLGTDTFDAENNWWGSADGPGPVGPGSGDNVSINVDYDPWLPIDRIAVIRHKTTGKQGLFIYYVPLNLGGQTEPPVATDRQFGNSNWGNNIIAMACIDTDGNGADEIAVIRQRPNGRQRLEIYNPPQSEGGDTGPPIASDLSFGHLNLDKNNIAMAGVDINGDGTDEIAVIREKQTGKQRLFIFNAPQGIGGQTEPAIATDMTFGFRGTGRNIIAMTGLDMDGDGTDEIAVIMQRSSGRQRLEVYDAPQGVGGETGPPIASDLTFGNSTTRKNTILITDVDLNRDGKDDLAVVRQGISGRQRLEIYNPPEAPGGETGPPIASDLTFGRAGTHKYTIFISGIKF